MTDGVKVWRGVPATMFFMGILGFGVGVAYSMTLPTLRFLVEAPRSHDPPGLGSSSFLYSIAIGIYGVGEFAGSLACGVLSVKTTVRLLLMSLLFIAVIGSVMQALATDIAILIVGRVVLGIYSGGFATVIRAYLGRVTLPRQMSRTVIVLTCMSSSGYALGPAFTSLLIWWNPTGSSGPARLDQYRAPFWFLACMLFMDLILVLCGFREVRTQVVDPAAVPLLTAKQAVEAKQLQEEIDVGSRGPKSGASSCCSSVFGKIWSPGRVPSWVLAASISFFCFANGCIALIEGVFVLVVSDNIGMAVQYASLWLLAAGSVGVLALFPLFVLAPRTADWKMQVGVFLAITLGAFCSADYQALSYDSCTRYSCPSGDTSCTGPSYGPDVCVSHMECHWNQEDCASCTALCYSPSKRLNLPQFVAGSALILLGGLVGRSVLSAQYGKLLGPRPQGKMIGLTVAAAAVGRVVFPIVGIAVYVSSGRRTFPLMMVIATCGMICATVLWLKQKAFCHLTYHGNPAQSKH